MNSEQIIYLIAYIMIYSFLGWVLESTYKTIYQKKFVNSGFLIGPICPIYGFGAAIMYLFLDQFKSNIFMLFVAGVIILSIWEYLVGFLLEKLFKTKYWDYSGKKFNLHGRICLMNSIIWGVLGVIFTVLLHPIIEQVVGQFETSMLVYLEIILTIALIVDSVISVTKITNINIGIDKLVEITDTIKSKMDELKSLTGKANEKSRDSIKLIIEELKQKQDNLKETISKKTSRLRLAFPSMKSENISKLLNKKIDILGMLKNDKK